MKLYSGIVLFLIATGSLTAQKPADLSSQEPKSTFQVNINGKIYVLEENRELKIDANFSKPTISIKLSDRKKFQTDFMSFEYPRHYAFEFEKDEDYRSWTFTGNNITVMLFDFNQKVPFDIYINEIESKFGKENCVVTPLQKSLGGKPCNGKSLKITLAGQRLDMEIYEVILSDDNSRFLYFQNALKDDGSSTEEYINGYTIIQSTLSYVK